MGTDATEKARAAGKGKEDAKGKFGSKHELVTVKAGALSKDAGVQVLTLMDAFVTDADKATSLMASAKEKAWQASAIMVTAILKAAKGDTSIDLNVAFQSDEEGAKAAQRKLNDQIRVAMGLMEVRTVTDTETGESKKSLEWTAAADKIYGKWDKSRQQNFTTALKKAIKAAADIADNKMTAEYVPEAHTLAISGPAVKKRYGTDKVLLNEKQTQALPGSETETKLKAKPSYQDLATHAGEKRGIVVAARGGNHAGRVDSRKVQVTGTTDEAFTALCTSLTGAINRLVNGTGDGKPPQGLSTKQHAAALSLRNVLNDVLGK